MLPTLRGLSGHWVSPTTNVDVGSRVQQPHPKEGQVKLCHFKSPVRSAGCGSNCDWRKTDDSVTAAGLKRVVLLPPRCERNQSCVRAVLQESLDHHRFGLMVIVKLNANESVCGIAQVLAHTGSWTPPMSAQAKAGTCTPRDHASVAHEELLSV